MHKTSRSAPHIIHNMKTPHAFTSIAASLAALTLLLAGCASPSAPVDDCKDADWFEVGYKDGNRGMAAPSMAQRVDICAKKGVVLDAASYQKGRDEATASLCSATGGWREGSLGNPDKANACKGHSGEAEFSRYFVLGQERFRLAEVRRKNDEELVRLNNLENSTINPIERRTLRERIRVLKLEQAQVRKQQGAQNLLAPN